MGMNGSTTSVIETACYTIQHQVKFNKSDGYSIWYDLFNNVSQLTQHQLRSSISLPGWQNELVSSFFKWEKVRHHISDTKRQMSGSAAFHLYRSCFSRHFQLVFALKYHVFRSHFGLDNYKLEIALEDTGYYICGAIPLIKFWSDTK